MKTISQTQLRDILAAKRGASFVTISALTDARARKTGNPFLAILKLSKVNGTINANYENSVNRQLAREGKEQLTFTAKPRAWGQRIEGTPLVEHKGKYYLSILPRHARKPFFFGKTAEGFLKQVAKSAIESFLPPVRSSAEAQGVDKEVVTRDFSLESIGAIAIDGEQFRVRSA